MHDIEPYFKWRDLYQAERDKNSPFYGRHYSEFQFSNRIYNYYIHPQWDFYGSGTMCMKLLFVDYDLRFAIIEVLGEWNDCITNDIMILKRDVIDQLINNGIYKFVIICENVLNYHAGEMDYYEEWVDDLLDNNGWVSMLNLQPHVLSEMMDNQLEKYCRIGEEYDMAWRGLKPKDIVGEIERRAVNG